MTTAFTDPRLEPIRAVLADREALMRRGIMTDRATGLRYYTGYEYEVLYDWDQYFEALVQIYMGWPAEFIVNGVRLFLAAQRADGLIPRSIPACGEHVDEHAKPFLAQIALLAHRAYGELDWLKDGDAFVRLQRYLDYWLNEMDGDGNGLSEWLSGPHTGMDNQHERAGFWGDRISEGVDLNSYLVRELRAFARLAGLLGRGDLATRYDHLADERAALIRTMLWDEKDGLFYDGNARFGLEPYSVHAGFGAALNFSPLRKERLIRVKSIASFAALWAGVATAEQARRMVVEHLFNPREFLTPYPFATLARSERWYATDTFPADLGCNWRANVWIPTNYMICHALRRYGFREQAATAVGETVRLVRSAGDREYYCAETGQGRGLNPFWGWSLLAHFMPYEEESGIDLTEI
jgi:putative isomerase